LAFRKASSNRLRSLMTNSARAVTFSRACIEAVAATWATRFTETGNRTRSA
jgi:hypothetical protein